MKELKVYVDRILVALAGHVEDNIQLEKYDFVIAVDGGYDNLLRIGITPNLVIGDLDSIKTTNQIDTIKFESVKDDTDYLCAIKYIQNNYSNYQVDVIGFASTNRIDHVLANLSIFDPKVRLISTNQVVTFHTSRFTINKEKYKYTSFFSLTPINDFCLNGFKYELTSYKLFPFDPLCISNEIVDQVATVDFDEGKLMCIRSKEN